MNYLQSIQTYFEQEAYESAALVCDNAFKATSDKYYMHAAKRFRDALQGATRMSSTIAAADALWLAIKASSEGNLL